MRLQRLLEARRKNDRRQVRQQLAHEYRGPGGADLDPQQFSANAPWQRKVAVIFREMNVPPVDRRRIMDALKVVARSKGRDEMQRYSVKTLTVAIDRMTRQFAFERSRPVAHQRAGVSGAYTQTVGGSQPRYTSALNPQNDIHKLSQKDIASHPDPNIRHISTAFRPDAGNKAVVYDLNNIPYYIFVKPYKLPPGTLPKEGKDIVFTAVIPHGLKPTENNIALWKKENPEIRKEMKSEAGMEILGEYKTKNFQDAIAHFQRTAWEKSKDWFQIYNYYKVSKNIQDHLEKKLVSGRALSPEEDAALEKAQIATATMYSIIRGKLPTEYSPEAKLTPGLRKVVHGATEAFKWYVWLLVAEDEYGIRLPERRKLYPTFPTTPNTIKSHPYQWAIQPKRKQGGKFDWDQDVIKGLGYSVNSWKEFIKDLENSHYRFTRSDAEIQNIWLPLVGSVRDKFGLKLHPQNISDYISASHTNGKVLSTASYVAGKTANKLTVKKGMKARMYIFHGPRNREFALIPAASYHQYFDSPYHGGKRLIHGESKLQEPVSRLALSKGKRWGDRTKNRAQSYRDLRGVSRGADRRMDQIHVRNPEQERLVRDADMAAQSIRLAKETLLQKDARIKRIAARRNSPVWQAPTAVARNTQRKKGEWVATRDSGRQKRYVVTPMSPQEIRQWGWEFDRFTSSPKDNPDSGAQQPRPGTFKTKRRRLLRGSDLEHYSYPHKGSRG